MKFVRQLYTAALLIAVPAVLAAQSSIGNWNGSGRSWNNGSMATIKSTMLGRGHTVHADAAMTAGNLALYDVFVIGEATSTPSMLDLAALSSWVGSGGRLIMLWDSGNSGNPGGNNILAGIGSSMSVGPGGASGCSPLQAGNFATEGGPYNIVGGALGCSPGMAVSGGATLLTNYVHYEAMGSGFVYAMGDRFDHNFFAPSDDDNNGKMFINIVESEQNPGVVPEPASVVLMATGLVGVIAAVRRRRA